MTDKFESELGENRKKIVSAKRALRIVENAETYDVVGITRDGINFNVSTVRIFVPEYELYITYADADGVGYTLVSEEPILEADADFEYIEGISEVSAEEGIREFTRAYDVLDCECEIQADDDDDFDSILDLVTYDDEDEEY